MVLSNEEIEREKNDDRYRSKKKYLIFSLADIRYAIPLSKVKEVIGMTNITPLPKVPNFYKGLLNLRGQIISIIDLRSKLGLQKAEINPKKTGIIISHVGDILLGAIVDEVIEVVGYNDSEIDQSEAQRVKKSGDGVVGIAQDDNGELTLLIDIESALNSTDFKVLKEQMSS
jgi:purine-binding chemotaxis protein CheW